MARQKKIALAPTDEELAEKQTNKDIGELVYYTYTTYKGGKPDASVYSGTRRILEPLFKGDDKTRAYTLEELKKAIDAIIENDIAFTSFTILHWPDLVRAIVDDDKQATRYAIDRIKSSQRSQGYYGVKSLKDSKPAGW